MKGKFYRILTSMVSGSSGTIGIDEQLITDETN